MARQILDSVIIEFREELRRILSPSHLSWMFEQAENELLTVHQLSPNTYIHAEQIYHEYAKRGVDLSLRGLDRLIKEVEGMTSAGQFEREISDAKNALADAKKKKDYEVAIQTASNAFRDLTQTKKDAQIWANYRREHAGSKRHVYH